MSMTCHVERYVALKRHLGFKFNEQERVLGIYAKHADDHGDEFILCSRMIEAATGTAKLTTVRKHLVILRNFALWLHSEDERHEVLPRNVLGQPETRRRTPCLMTPEEIRKVMNAALDLAACRFNHTAQHLLHDRTRRGHGNASKRGCFADDIGPHPRRCCYPGDKVQEIEARSLAPYRSRSSRSVSGDPEADRSCSRPPVRSIERQSGSARAPLRKVHRSCDKDGNQEGTVRGTQPSQFAPYLRGQIAGNGRYDQSRRH